MVMLSRDQIYTDQNRPKTLCLIVELCKYTDSPLFTIRDEKEGYVSLQKLFIDHVTDDPSEVDFAEVVFGDVLFWMNMRDNKQIKPFVEDWRAICDAKRKSKAFKSIISEVEGGGRSAFTAAKFLIEEPWKDKRNPKDKQESEDSSTKAFSGYADDIKKLKEAGHIQ